MCVRTSAGEVDKALWPDCHGRAVLCSIATRGALTGVVSVRILVVEDSIGAVLIDTRSFSPKKVFQNQDHMTVPSEVLRFGLSCRQFLCVGHSTQSTYHMLRIIWASALRVNIACHDRHEDAQEQGETGTGEWALCTQQGHGLE